MRCWSALQPPGGGAASSTAEKVGDGSAIPAADEVKENNEEMARSLVMLIVKQHHHASLYACQSARERRKTLAAKFRSQVPSQEVNVRMQLDQTQRPTSISSSTSVGVS